MANSEAKKQSNSIYYNIDIYNDNSTNADISSKFSTAFNSPLLMDTSNYEVAVARARIPLDQIPLSQENIPFHKWQIEIGVPSTMSLNDYTYYSSYVPQFNPVPASLAYFDTAIIGFFRSDLQVITLPVGTLSGNVPLNLQTYNNSTVQQTNLINSHNLSNIAYATSYYYVVNTLTTLDAYGYGDNTPIAYLSTYPGVNNSQIFGICATQASDTFYVLVYDLDALQLVILTYEGINAQLPSTFTLCGAPSTVNINSFSCNGTYISVSVQDGNTCQIYNCSTDNFIGAPQLLPNQPAVVENFMIYTYVDVNNVYYQAPVRQNIGPRDHDFRSYDINNPQDPWTDIFLYDIQARTFTRFMGNDINGNIMACYTNNTADTGETGFRIESYSVTTPQQGCDYFITTPTEPYSLCKFTTISNPVPEGPSLTPNYQVMTINDYLRQINMGFVDAFSQIPQPYSSPTIAPRLVFDSAASIVSIVCDPGCATSLANACVINFNQLLWSLFKFNSIAAVYTALPSIGGVVQTLEIDDVASGAKLSITPQPNSTIYRFSDLTRIIIGTTRMGVYGDNQNNDKLLVNIGDFTVDTENGIPNLIIYNPFILRFYKLYQNTPLTNIDVFVSYANRAGEVFPITISPYNSIGLKLEFQRIPMTTQ